MFKFLNAVYLAHFSLLLFKIVYDFVSFEEIHIKAFHCVEKEKLISYGKGKWKITSFCQPNKFGIKLGEYFFH